MTHKYKLLFHLRLPKLEDECPVFISLKKRVAKLYPRELGSLYVKSYNSQVYGGGNLTSLHTGLKMKLIYDRLTDRESVLVSGSHLKLLTTFLLSVLPLQVSCCGAPSLTRGRVYNLLIQLLLGFARAVILGPKSRDLFDSTNLEVQVSVFISHRNKYPQALSSLFVAPYDLQDYGGVILTRLHTKYSLKSLLCSDEKEGYN
jgi:hypothetical protein